jgi:diguanylate cyclase (GGDEF)-like protein
MGIAALMDASRGEEPGAGRVSLRWMYLLIAVPLVTDIIETGGWPRSLREWLTESVGGLLIALLVGRVIDQQRKVALLARSDALTGLWNRRAFEEALQDECVRARRSGQALSLIYLDLDNFKHVNDRSGHDAGDRALRQLADAIRQVVRDRVDRGFRLGGDEFAVLLPGGSAAQAEDVVRRVADHCRGTDALWRDGPLGISAGTVEFQAQESATDLVRRADEAMFHAKRSGGRSLTRPR